MANKYVPDKPEGIPEKIVIHKPDGRILEAEGIFYEDGERIQRLWVDADTVTMRRTNELVERTKEGRCEAYRGHVPRRRCALRVHSEEVPHAFVGDGGWEFSERQKFEREERVRALARELLDALEEIKRLRAMIGKNEEERDG